MKIKDLDEKTLEKVEGGFSDYDPGPFRDQKFVLDEYEAKFLGVDAGTYARSELAQKLLDKAHILSLTSEQADKLATAASWHGKAKHLREVLDSLGLERKE